MLEEVPRERVADEDAGALEVLAAPEGVEAVAARREEGVRRDPVGARGVERSFMIARVAALGSEKRTPFVAPAAVM